MAGHENERAGRHQIHIAQQFGAFSVREKKVEKNQIESLFPQMPIRFSKAGSNRQAEGRAVIFKRPLDQINMGALILNQ